MTYSITTEKIGVHTFYVPLYNGKHIPKTTPNPYGRKYALYDKRKSAENFIERQKSKGKR